jgi:hypothetical protein
MGHSDTVLKIVGFETAKKLYICGFSTWNDSYDINGQVIPLRQQARRVEQCRFPAPTLALAQKWLMDDHKLIIQVIPFDSWDNWVFKILAEDCMSPFFEAHDEMKEFNSYDEALEAGILEATNLIK